MILSTNILAGFSLPISSSSTGGRRRTSWDFCLMTKTEILGQDEERLRKVDLLLIRIRHRFGACILVKRFY